MVNHFKLPKKAILRGKDNFKKLFEQGTVVSGPNVSIFFLDADSRKIGFAVSKSIKQAVKRNRYKRILREIYRLNELQFPPKKSIILFAKGKCDNFFVLQKEILGLLSKLNNI